MPELTPYQRGAITGYEKGVEETREKYESRIDKLRGVYSEKLKSLEVHSPQYRFISDLLNQIRKLRHN